ncbi:MAG TPA: response regulator [Trichormus sp.]
MNRVLLVDDDRSIRRIAQIALAEVGHFQVMLASTGQEALNLAQKEQPDLVLLDVMMPEMDGFAVLIKLQKDPTTSAIPVIFMTASVTEDEQLQYRTLGVRGVIVKPFDPMTLAEQIKHILSENEGSIR